MNNWSAATLLANAGMDTLVFDGPPVNGLVAPSNFGLVDPLAEPFEVGTTFTLTSSIFPLDVGLKGNFPSRNSVPISSSSIKISFPQIR